MHRLPVSLEVLLVDSPIHEERLVAQRLLEEHLIQGRPLDTMAVILRNGSQVRSMAKYLAGAGHRGEHPAGRNAAARGTRGAPAAGFDVPCPGARGASRIRCCSRNC